MLKRYLRTALTLVHREYCTGGLPVEYAMVPPNYADQRTGLAKQIGLANRPPPRQLEEKHNCRSLR
ncbi:MULTISPECIES: MucR family transcriptional regulator [Nitrospirillum]|uniref:Uncharacterized protein n=1 Tax=Nitrospirillum viridazoti CBAmc TaxID=1441467 RepID=A0A248JWW8_9PROT|nr:hypothetical protein Y958_20540 [Nitrospirillum amazonense CBAmc]TWB38982.1 ROS/MUCR transcriptional regulator protein [Nitrospirillum amazonense]